MSTLLRLVAFAALFAHAPHLAAQAEDQKQILATLNSVEKRLWSGEIAALDDVKALPGDHAVAGLLMFFKQYFYVYSTETKKKAIAKKAAIYITKCPTAATYFKNLFRKEEGRPKSGMLIQMREATLDALTDAGNAFAVKLLFELMDETNIEVPVGDFGVALAKMSISGAPFSREQARSASTAEGISKWKEWWSSNKDSLKDG